MLLLQVYELAKLAQIDFLDSPLKTMPPQTNDISVVSIRLYTLKTISPQTNNTSVVSSTGAYRNTPLQNPMIR
ncbi:MAG TPA: hypothetical protein PLX23_07110 [Candidatus Hydrogenedens sp.]|nr:hypothetical protein [Candidatus Hydrogenedens sp.]